MEIFFHTDDSDTMTGWSLSWSVVTPGEKTLMLNNIGIFHQFELDHSYGSIPFHRQINAMVSSHWNPLKKLLCLIVAGLQNL